jgi:hypothetical protein
MMKAIFLFALALALIGCKTAAPQKPAAPAAPASATPNCVAAYLAEADLQFETDEQRAEITRALREMLTKSPEELKSVRYADYTGKAGSWSARQLLERYFLSSSHAVFDEDCFYRDVSAPEARNALQKRLDDLVKEK